MKNLFHQWKCNQRIECYEAGYPACEARFLSIKEWAIFKIKELIK